MKQADLPRLHISAAKFSKSKRCIALTCIDGYMPILHQYVSSVYLSASLVPYPLSRCAEPKSPKYFQRWQKARKKMVVVAASILVSARIVICA